MLTSLTKLGFASPGSDNNDAELIQLDEHLRCILTLLVGREYFDGLDLVTKLSGWASK